MKNPGNGGQTDVLTVIHELKKSGKLDFVGGAYAVSVMVNEAAFNGSIEKHCLIIHEDFIKRQLFRVANLLHGKVFEPAADPFDMIESTIKTLTSITDTIQPNSCRSIQEYVNEALKDCREAREGQMASVPAFLSALQKLFGGFKKKRVTVIAARPGMGKTVAGLGAAVYAARLGRMAAIFSQEMGGTELAERFLSAESGINAMKISNNALSEDELTYLEGHSAFDNLPLYIDETPGLTIQQIRNRATRLKRERNLELLVVDFLQLCESENERDQREQQISKISRGLKKLAKELDISIIALSQLNRQNEARADKKPQLADLRESGAIEQDADTVILLHRPEVYAIPEYQLGANNYPSAGLLVMIIAKNRGGIMGEIPCRWLGSTLEIKDYPKD